MSHIALYPLTDCTFGSKEAKPDRYPTNDHKLARLREKYKKEGLQRSVEAVLLVHNHGHPHILLLQKANQTFTLPGGWLHPGEDETSGLQRKLRNSLSPLAAALNHEWEIGECLATYWRPHFESNTYPYLPVHITRPKEIRKLFTVHLPERCYFAVPTNFKLVAIPFYECCEGLSKFGTVISTLPHLLSRYRMTISGEYKQMQIDHKPSGDT